MVQSTWLATVKNVVRHEGVLGLYRGVSPTLIGAPCCVLEAAFLGDCRVPCALVTEGVRGGARAARREKMTLAAMERQAVSWCV